MRSSSMDNSCDNKAYWAFAGGRRFHLLSRHFDMNAFYVFSMKSHDLFPFRSAVRTAAFVIEATGISVYRTTTKKLRCRESSINFVVGLFSISSSLLVCRIHDSTMHDKMPNNFISPTFWVIMYLFTPPPPPPHPPPSLQYSQSVTELMRFFRASARACVCVCVCVCKIYIYIYVREWSLFMWTVLIWIWCDYLSPYQTVCVCVCFDCPCRVQSQDLDLMPGRVSYLSAFTSIIRPRATE